jgi:hypothetical protein
MSSPGRCRASGVKLGRNPLNARMVLRMKASVVGVVLLCATPASAYDASTRGTIELALDAALGRGDYESACRHAINLGTHLNSTGRLSVVDMKKIGKVCSAVR